MNRQYLLGGLVVLALVLFAVPLVSPVPAQEPAAEVLRDPNSSDQPYPVTNETVAYENLSSDAQRWFDELPQSEESYAAEIVPIDSPPEPWASFVPNGSEMNASPGNDQIDQQRRFWSLFTYAQVEKDDRYHLVALKRIEPRPPQQAVALRLGALVSSIGLLGFAGQQWLEGKR